MSTSLRPDELDTKTTKDLKPVGNGLKPNNIEQNHGDTKDFIDAVKEETLEKETCHKEILGPGWYGKGCAKMKKPKKRRKLK